MRRALSITLGIVLYLALFGGLLVLVDDWHGVLPTLARGVLQGLLVAVGLLLAIHYDVWGYGTLVRRREQERRDRRKR